MFKYAIKNNNKTQKERNSTPRKTKKNITSTFSDLDQSPWAQKPAELSLLQAPPPGHWEWKTSLGYPLIEIAMEHGRFIDDFHFFENGDLK